MAKKRNAPRHDRHVQGEPMEDIPPLQTFEPIDNTEPAEPPMPATYEGIRETLKTRIPDMATVRAESLRVQNDTAHIIAELEAWRAEIDATIAFLRAHR